MCSPLSWAYYSQQSHNVYLINNFRELGPSPTCAADEVLPPLLPLEVMATPLALRFRYHFEGDKQTNRQDKVIPPTHKHNVNLTSNSPSGSSAIFLPS